MKSNTILGLGLEIDHTFGCADLPSHSLVFAEGGHTLMCVDCAYICMEVGLQAICKYFVWKSYKNP